MARAKPSFVVACGVALTVGWVFAVLPAHRRRQNYIWSVARSVTAKPVVATAPPRMDCRADHAILLIAKRWSGFRTGFSSRQLSRGELPSACRIACHHGKQHWTNATLAQYKMYDLFSRGDQFNIRCQGAIQTQKWKRR